MQPDQTTQTDRISRLTRTEGYSQVGPGNTGAPAMAIAGRRLGRHKTRCGQAPAAVVKRHAGE